MTNDKALEAARAAYRNAEENPRFVECPRCKGVGYHHGFGEDGNDPDWCSQCGGSQQIMPADEADRPLIEAISAYFAALPGEAEVVAWTDDTDERVPVASRGATRNSETAKYWAHTAGAPLTPLVTLASFQAMQARAEAAEREREEALALVNYAEDVSKEVAARAEAAEARVKELEEALDERERELSEIQTAQGMPSNFTFKGKTYLRRITMVRELDGSTTRTIEVVSPPKFHPHRTHRRLQWLG